MNIESIKKVIMNLKYKLFPCWCSCGDDMSHFVLQFHIVYRSFF